MNTNELIIYKKTLPPRTGDYVEHPHNLSPELSQFLNENGMKSLYSHQAEMFTKAVEGKSIVITTSTASGKTLSFLLPVIQEILENPLARAIFIYPTKALASDQYRAIKPYLDYFGADRISAGVYDGDTPVNERSRIRKSANIILTNPEMINSAFLPNHSNFGFDFIFSNLKYVVIDELHTYRGAFGSHLANVFRRLQRVCKYYHSCPRYLCSSATIANPVELASEICGQSFVLIDRDGSPSPEKKYAVIQPPSIKGAQDKDYGRIPITTVAAHLVPELVVNDKSFITFVKSRKNVEIVLKESRDKLESEGIFNASMTDKISGYRGGYTPNERKEIEHKMVSGVLKGLISTNALELGIDIGKINTTVLVGYPGTRASFWQQTGRAGRSGRECTNYLILDNQPFDQYITIDPDWLFEHDSENAVIDKNNLLIQLAHIRAAAAELPLTLDDISLFPDLGEIIPVLMKVRELTGMNGKFIWSGKTFPAGDYSLRNIDKSRYKLINKENGKEITEMDEMQAFREIHNGAVYMHDGVLYQVIKLDLESKTAQAVPFNGNYYTMPGGNTFIRMIQRFKDTEYRRTHIAFGDVNVDESVYMYKKLQFHNHQNLGYEQLSEPLSKDYDTESTWIKVPSDVVEVFRKLLQRNETGQVVRNNHFEGLCHAIKSAAMMVTMTAQDDIDVNVSSNAITPDGVMEFDVVIYIYDKYVGGLGYSEKIYDLTPKILENAIRMVSGCHCKDGCPACVGDYKLDKGMVKWGLESFLEKQTPPAGMKAVEPDLETTVKKPFRFEQLQEKWPEFCRYVSGQGDAFAGFLESVPKAEVSGHMLTLTVTSPFYRDWVMEKTNKKSLVNIIRYHAECPPGIDIAICVDGNTQEHSNVRSKLQRRYENLTE
ncbi:MAG: DEAD/DEAH box helicase [Lacrimispora sp.]|uniref:DEAD/DEAH box helicase n=1 Tax=Lacrimispora sp. TaxID=2719234 RepID=UPI0039E2F1B3